MESTSRNDIHVYYTALVLFLKLPLTLFKSNVNFSMTAQSLQEL